MTITTLNPFTDAEIKKFAPSVFGTDRNELRSSKYSLFNTSDIIHEMRNLGYEVTNVSTNGIRKETVLNNPLTRKHMIRFSHRDYLNTKDSHLAVGSVVPQILLTNSHNGTSSYQIAAGLWRKVCSNGLCVNTANIEAFRVRHIGHNMDEVIKASLSCASRSNEIIDSVYEMNGITLTDKQVKDFVHDALKIKIGDDPKRLNKVENPMVITTRHREEDAPNTLWNVFNAIQENYMKGGIRLIDRTLRPIRNIEENTRINRELWKLADDYRLNIAA